MNWLLDLTPDEWNAVRLSIKVATVAMIASLPPGILLAFLLARGRFWGKTLLNGLVHLPLILPPVVTGYLLLLSFGRRGPAGAFLAAGLVVWPCVRLIAGAYTADPATLALAVPAMLVACLMFTPDALQVVVAQALRARGDVWLPTGTHMVSYFGVMIPLAWLLAVNAGWGIRGLSAGIVVASVVSAGLLLIRFRMLRTRL